MTDTPSKKIILLTPRGFCAGVVRAIDVVKIALNLYGAPIYVRKEIVHNRHVVDELRGAGAIFVEELDEVPEGARVIFSAHGVSPAVRAQAKQRRLQVIDATCPLVTKVHLEAVKFAKKGYTIVLIGHKDHDEVIGTLGEAPESTVLVSTVEDVDRLEVRDPTRVSFITQTTLSLDETKDIVDRLRQRFPEIQGPAAQDICYATENRQLAVKAVVPLCEVLLVVGSQNSSNSRRLVEVCEKTGVPAYLIDDLREVRPEWLDGVRTVAVTAGASAPENLVQELIGSLKERGFSELEEMEIKEEDVRFHLPSELAKTVQLQAAPRLRGCRGRRAPRRDVYEPWRTDRGSIGERLRRGAAAGGQLSARAATPRRLLVGGSHRRHHPRIGFYSARTVAPPAGERRLEPPHPGVDRQSGAVDPGTAVARWRIQYLRRRSIGAQCDHQGVHGLKTGRGVRTRSQPGAGAGAYSVARGIAARQLLRQGQSEPVRPLSARAYSVDSAGADAARQLYLRDVELDARHRDPALDRARDESAAAGSGRIFAERTVQARRAVRISQ